jgi:hypothetical protein
MDQESDSARSTFWIVWSIVGFIAFIMAASQLCPFAGCSGIIVFVFGIPALLVGGGVWLVAGLAISKMIGKSPDLESIDRDEETSDADKPRREP